MLVITQHLEREKVKLYNLGDHGVKFLPRNAIPDLVYRPH